MVKWLCLQAFLSDDDAAVKNHLDQNDGKSRQSKTRKEGGAFITRASDVPTKLVKYNTTAPLWDQEKRSTGVHHAEVLIARQKHIHAEAAEQDGETENQNTIVAPGLPEVTKVQRLITFGHQRQAQAEEAISLKKRTIAASPDDIPLLQTVPGDTAKYITPVLASSNKHVEDRDAKDGSFQSQQNLRKALFRDNALEYSSSSEEEESSSEEEEEEDEPPPPPPQPTPVPTPKPTPVITPIPSLPLPKSPEEEESSSSEEEEEQPPKPVVVPVVVPPPPEPSSSSEEEEEEPPKPAKVPSPEESSSSEEEEEEPTKPPPPPIKKKVEPRPCPPHKTATFVESDNNTSCGTTLFDFNNINDSLWKTRKLLFGDYITMVKPCPPPPPPPPPPPEPNCGCGTECCDCCCCSCDCCDENPRNRDENNNVTEKKVPVSPPKPLLTPPPPQPPPAQVTVQQAMTHSRNPPPPRQVPAPVKKSHPCRPRSKSKKRRSKSKSKSRSKPKKKCKPSSKKRKTNGGSRGAASGCCGGSAPGGGCCGPPRMACGCCLYEESSSSSSSSESEDDGIRPGASFPTEFLWFMLTMNSTSQYYKLNSSYQANYCAALAREKHEAAQKPYVNTVDVGCLEEIVCQEGEEVLRNKELAITLRHFPKDSNCLPQNPLIDLNSMKLFTSGEKETECCCKRKCCGKAKCGKNSKEMNKKNKDEESDEEEEESDEEDEDSDEKQKIDNKKKAHHPHQPQPPPTQLNSSPPAQYLVNCNNIPGYTSPQPVPMQPFVSPQPCYPTYPCYPSYSAYPPVCPPVCQPPYPYLPCTPGTYCYPPPCPPPPWGGSGGPPPQPNPNDFGGGGGGANGYDDFGGGGANGYDNYGYNEDEYYGNGYDENYEGDYYEGEGNYYDGNNEFGNGGNMRSCDNDPRVLEWNRNNKGTGKRGSNNSNGSNDVADAGRTVSFNQAARARGSKDSSYIITLDPLGNYTRSNKKEYNENKSNANRMNPNGTTNDNKKNNRDSNVSNSSSLNLRVVRGSKDITNHKIY